MSMAAMAANASPSGCLRQPDRHAMNFRSAPRSDIRSGESRDYREGGRRAEEEKVGVAAPHRRAVVLDQIDRAVAAVRHRSNVLLPILFPSLDGPISLTILLNG